MREHLSASDDEVTVEQAGQWIFGARAVAETARQLAIAQDDSLGLDENAEDLRWAALDILVSGEGLDPCCLGAIQDLRTVAFCQPWNSRNL